MLLLVARLSYEEEMVFCFFLSHFQINARQSDFKHPEISVQPTLRLTLIIQKLLLIAIH